MVWQSYQVCQFATDPKRSVQIGGKQLEPMSIVNIFTSYKQEENHFTNGLIALLRLSRYDRPRFIASFLRDQLSLEPKEGIDSFRVLRGIQGTVDGELCCKDCCIQFETKIASGTLRVEQVRNHLSQLQLRPEMLKKLVLLTPDDGNSKYIERFLLIDKHHVLHLEWKSVYNYLDNSIRNHTGTVFSELVRQFLERIHHRVFEQDIAGIIAKIDFGDRSEVYADRYLSEMEKGSWTKWNTPRQYKSLDGTGRKLMLYDRTRKGITVEVEIHEVRRTDSELDYPWSNIFVHDKLFIYRKPIPLSRIQTIPGFDNFGVHRKDRSAYRNITHEQYRQLTENQSKIREDRTSRST